MLKLRQFKFSDLKEVMLIERVSFPKSRPYPKKYFLRYFNKYPKGFIVAENKGKIIGYAIAETRRKIGEFVSLAVRPGLRQKGIGTKLTNFLIKSFQKSGLKDIFLNVRAKNRRAISFYKNFGFKISKKVKKYYQNGDDAYMMKWETDG